MDTVPDSQHVAGAAATIQIIWSDDQGDPVAASGAVTVRVQTADGTDIVAAGSSTTTTSDAGVYQRALTATQTATLNELTATWTDAGSGVSRVTRHAIVGGVYFSAADARAFDPTVNSLANAARVHLIRLEVEAECERITGIAWVPRYRRVTVSGTGDTTMVLPDSGIRTIRTARTYTTPTTYTAFTSTQLAALAVFDDGTITRTDGNVFNEGDGNLVFEYEHGRDRLPADLRHATLTRLRSRLKMELTSIPDRATSFVMEGGGAFRLAQPGPYSTGLPEVDAVYNRYSLRNTRVVGRLVNYDPQRNSLFHGGPR